MKPHTRRYTPDLERYSTRALLRAAGIPDHVVTEMYDEKRHGDFADMAEYLTKCHQEIRRMRLEMEV